MLHVLRVLHVTARLAVCITLSIKRLYTMNSDFMHNAEEKRVTDSRHKCAHESRK